MKNKSILLIYTVLLAFSVILASCGSSDVSTTLEKDVISSSNGITESNENYAEAGSVIAVPVPVQVYDENDPEMARGGGQGGCIHDISFNDSYHTITGAIVTYVNNKFGDGAYENWQVEGRQLSDDKADENCPFSELTIYTLIKSFNIPRDDFDLLYTNTLDFCGIDYNVELLYTDNIEEIEEYYTTYPDANRETRIFYNMNVRTIKDLLTTNFYTTDVSEEYNAYVNVLCSEHAQWLAANCPFAPLSFIGQRYWSIPQYVQDFNVPRETLERIKEITENPVQGFKFTIDIDKIYSDDPILAEALASGADIDIIDAMVVIPRVTDTLN